MLQMMNIGHAGMAIWGLSHINVAQNAFALDVGCGGGANIKRLLHSCAKGCVKGLDYSPVSVEKSRRLNADAIKAGRCQVLEGSVAQLPFEAGSFNLVTAFETVYFWPNLHQAFLQVYRVLKPNGQLMICNEANGRNPKDERWAGIIEDMKIYRSDQLEATLREAGFSGISTDESRKSWLCIVAEKRADAP